MPMANPAWPRYNNLSAPTGDIDRDERATPTSLGYGQNIGIYDLDRDGFAEVIWTASNHFVSKRWLRYQHCRHCKGTATYGNKQIIAALKPLFFYSEEFHLWSASLSMGQ